MVSDGVRVEREGASARVLLDRPERRNALALAGFAALAEAFQQLGDDPALRCIVLTGAGDAAFSAGYDIAAFPKERSTMALARANNPTIHAAFRAIEECPVPTLARIDGVCTGAGVVFAAACDLRICSETSRFGFPIKRLGLTLGLNEMRLVQSLVGKATMLEMLLEGRLHDSAWAVQRGLVHRAVASQALDEAVATSVQAISEGAPLAARWHKGFIARLESTEPISQAEEEESLACYDTDDFAEGYQAFLDKRTPQFRGR